MFGFLFWGESVWVEFLWFWPDLGIVVNGITWCGNNHALGYPYVTYPRISAANPLRPTKQNRDIFITCQMKLSSFPVFGRLNLSNYFGILVISFWNLHVNLVPVFHLKYIPVQLF